MPLQQTSGNVTADAYGGGAAAKANYIEDVFSTWLFNGGAFLDTVNVNNGFDMTTKKGLIMSKTRSTTGGFSFVDTTRGQDYTLFSNTTGAQAYQTTSTVNAFRSTGFSWITGSGGDNPTVAGWTLLQQPKFFDVVTWTGSNDSGTSIGQGIVPHSLGSAPGCVIIKNVTQGSTNWIVYHRSLSGGYRVLLNTTDAQTNSGSAAYFSKYDSSVGWVQTDPDANNIYVGYNYQTNGNGDTLVAYLFAHNAGGFGLTGTDNVISCGSYVGNGSTTGPIVTLGYEPQWVMIKNTGASLGDWNMADNMRGMAVNDTTTFNTQRLRANLSNAEGQSGWISPTATGFQIIGGNAANSNYNASGETYIYIAIRRGPMKVPTSGTSVFSPISSAASTGTVVTTGFPLDLQIQAYRGGPNSNFVDRLRGVSSTSTASGPYLQSASTAAEVSPGSTTQMVDNTSFQITAPFSGASTAYWNFRRAPGFFDEVCYTGTGSATTVTHNLGVAPEFMMVKERNGTNNWVGYAASEGPTKGRGWNSSNAFIAITGYWNDTAPTASAFTVGTAASTNGSGQQFVAYLFASCPGVSKVGSYTGNGSTQTINCGFAGGARFVLIKRTDDVGGWYVYDTARGMTTLVDPYLLLNSTAVESATLGSVTSVTTGFSVNASILAAINTNAASYIYLAIS